MPSFVTVGNRRVCYDTWGDPDGLPLFQLHGTPACRLNRYPVNERLAATGARVITYDRPGYGRSDRHPGRRVVDCVGDVAAIADDLGIDRFVVSGGSGGGPHCLAVAARLADRVIRARCVVGIAPYPAAGLDWFEGMDPENVKEFSWALAGEETLVPELRREASVMLERMAQDPATVLGDFQLSEADQVAMAHPITQRIFAEAMPETFANGVYGWADDDLAFTLPWGFDVGEIRVPTEICYGEHDVLTPPGHGRWLVANVPGAMANVKSGSGHMADPDQALAETTALISAARGGD